MRVPLLASLAVVAGAGVVAQTSAHTPAPRPERAEALASASRVALPEDLVFPNGIASAEDGSLYVGGVTSGRVWRRGPTGAWTVLFAGSDEVYGVTSLRLDQARGVLWGASPDAGAVLGVEAGRVARPHRVFALDVRTGALLASVVVPQGGFGNDLALDGEGGVFVTDSRLGRVWRLAADRRTWSVAATGPALAPGDGIGPAGIARLPSGDLIVGLFGRGALVRVRRPGPDATVEPIPIDRPLVRPDGMAVVDDRRVVLAVGGTGNLLLLDPETGATRRLLSGLAGPVNVDVRGGVAFVTESGIADPAAFDPARPDRSAMSVVKIPLETRP